MNQIDLVVGPDQELALLAPADLVALRSPHAQVDLRFRLKQLTAAFYEDAPGYWVDSSGVLTEDGGLWEFEHVPSITEDPLNPGLYIFAGGA